MKAHVVITFDEFIAKDSDDYEFLDSLSVDAFNEQLDLYKAAIKQNIQKIVEAKNINVSVLVEK